MTRINDHMSGLLSEGRSRRVGIVCVIVGILFLTILLMPTRTVIAAPTGETTYIAVLSGAAEVPGPGDADGAGLIELTLDAVAGEVCYSLTFSNIAAPTAGHIHTGAADESGGVLIGLFSDGADAAQGCVTGVSSDDIETVMTNPAGHYVNIHNADFAPGAIRGQLGNTAIVMEATLSGDAEVPGPGDDDGTGTARISVDAEAGVVCYTITFEQIDAPTAGHIHTGAADVSGGVLVGLFDNAADANRGCVDGVSEANANALLGTPADYYVNIHNEAFAAGAIRGQLATVAGTFTIELSGAAEVPDPGDADGSGTIVLSLDATAGEVCYSLTTADVATLTAGHIHAGVEGAAGGVVIGLFTEPDETATVSAASRVVNCVTADAATIQNILAAPQNFYVNLHNAEFPAGALRGQLPVVGVAQTPTDLDQESEPEMLFLPLMF